MPAFMTPPRLPLAVAAAAAERRTRPRVSMGAPVHSANVVEYIPHDATAFTQGLVFGPGGALYESTGLYGRSDVRKLNPTNGAVIRRELLPEQAFGEGLTVCRNCLLQLSWRSGRGFIRDLATLKELDRWSFQGDGWGLTIDDDERYLFLTDGTDVVRVLSAQSLEPLGGFSVRDGSRRIPLLNDVQYINGELWANLWMSDMIVVIDATSGIVLRWIDLRGLLKPTDIPRGLVPDVLNGISYCRTSGRLLVTGKHWPLMYDIRVDEHPTQFSVEETGQFFLDEDRVREFMQQMRII